MLRRYALFSASVSSLYHAIQQIERTEMAKFGLKGPHAQCLLAMSQYPQGITAAQLCQLCEKDKAAISRILAELSQAGMLCREDSRYRSPVTLTPSGVSAAQAISARARLAVEQAGAGLADDQREVFYQVLALIAGNLKTICLQGLPEETAPAPQQKGESHA